MNLTCARQLPEWAGNIYTFTALVNHRAVLKTLSGRKKSVAHWFSERPNYNAGMC